MSFSNTIKKEWHLKFITNATFQPTAIDFVLSIIIRAIADFTNGSYNLSIWNLQSSITNYWL